MPVPVVVVVCFTLSLTTRAIVHAPIYAIRMIALDASAVGN